MTIDFLSAMADMRLEPRLLLAKYTFCHLVNEKDNPWIHLYGNDPIFCLLSSAGGESHGWIWAHLLKKRRANFARVKQLEQWGEHMLLLAAREAAEAGRWKDHIRSEGDRVANPPPACGYSSPLSCPIFSLQEQITLAHLQQIS